MADNIRNFNDYRKKIKEEEQFTEEINIEIQDPLDFLTADEREEYYRTQHEAMDKERESLHEDSPEFYFDNEEQPPVNVQPQIRDTGEDIREVFESEKKPLPERETQRPVKEKRKPEKKKRPEPAPVKEKKNAIRKKTRVPDEEEFEEYEDSGSGIDPYLIVRISSVITGVIILVLIGMIFKAKVYDRYFRPDPDEIEVVAKVGELAGYTSTEDKVVTTTDLNLRNTPSVASDDFIVCQVPEGTVLERVAVSDDGEWAQVKFEGELLFCVMKYLAVQE